jgi:hypothetical protein
VAVGLRTAPARGYPGRPFQALVKVADPGRLRCAWALGCWMHAALPARVGHRLSLAKADPQCPLASTPANFKALPKFPKLVFVQQKEVAFTGTLPPF